MRPAPLLAATVLACLLLSGTAPAASAYPIKDRALTANELYRTGELQASRCAERDVQPNDAAAAKRYLIAVLNCLNRSWGAHFKRAGLPFTRPRIGFITKPRKYCGDAWGNASATYCYAEQRFLVLLDDSLLEDPSDLYLFRLVAHEYGHHVQYLTGIDHAYDRHPYRNKKELNEQSRRVELQAECLSGMFIGSVWDSLKDRDEEDWEVLREIMRKSGDVTHGKGHNIAAWLDKGFRATSPQVCNTWTASSSKVA
ncbi:neutral zinc metallopeptidase [Nonomuraea sp. NPDC004354]